MENEDFINMQKDSGSGGGGNGEEKNGVGEQVTLPTKDNQGPKAVKIRVDPKGGPGQVLNVEKISKEEYNKLRDEESKRKKGDNK